MCSFLLIFLLLSSSLASLSSSFLSLLLLFLLLYEFRSLDSSTISDDNNSSNDDDIFQLIALAVALWSSDGFGGERCAGKLAVPRIDTTFAKDYSELRVSSGLA